MVSLSNTSFLLSHVRNCFVTGDDTGICEILVDREIVLPQEIAAMLSSDGWCQPMIDTEDDMFGRESPEILFTDEKGRRKSSTERKLMEMKMVQQKDNTIEKIELSSSLPATLTEGEIENMFPMKTISALEQPKTKQSQQRPRSALSLLLEKSVNVRQNPFNDYAQFDASGSLTGVRSPRAQRLRKFNVYLQDLPASEKVKAIVVCPTRDTSVLQFIGLSLWLYTNAGREPILEGSLMDNLDVFMFEDLDDLDTDFPPLEKSDCIYKYEFDSLALVSREKRRPSVAQQVPAASTLERLVPKEGDDNIMVTIRMVHGNTIRRFSPNATMQEVLEGAIKKRKLKEHPDYVYRLERITVPGQPIDLASTLADMRETTFVLVRENSRREPVISEEVEPDDTEKLAEVLYSLPLKQYRVQVKDRPFNKDVILSVSDEKIEIEPYKQRLFKQKPTSYSIDVVADCKLLSNHERASGKVAFKLTCRTSGPGYSDIVSDLGSALAQENVGGAAGGMVLGPGGASGVILTGRSTGTPGASGSGANGHLSVGEYHSHVFESQYDVAKQICDQVLNILVYRGSWVRKTFLEEKARKTAKQHTPVPQTT